MLTTSEDDEDVHDKQLLGLNSIETIIGTNPFDLESLTPSLLRILLLLEDRYDLNLFQFKQFNAMTLIGIKYPQLSLLSLIDMFYNSMFSISNKLDCLQIIVDIAGILSGYKTFISSENTKASANETPTSEASTSTSSATSQLIKSSIQPLKKTVNNDENNPKINDMKVNKTRRWGYRRNAAPVIVRNDYSVLALDVFMSLSKALISNSSHYLLKASPNSSGSKSVPCASDSDSSTSTSIMLTTQTILSLTSLTEYSKNTPHISIIAETLLKSVWGLRNTNDAALRRAILLAITISLSYIEMDSHVLIDLSNDLIDFSYQVVNEDSDQMCRNAGRKVLQLTSLIETHSW